MDEDEIDDQCTALRKKLELEQTSKKEKITGKGLKSYQVHDLARAKIEEDERFRKALGIPETYEEGDHWNKQKERLKQSQDEKAKDEQKGDAEGSLRKSRGYDYD